MSPPFTPEDLGVTIAVLVDKPWRRRRKTGNSSSTDIVFKQQNLETEPSIMVGRVPIDISYQRSTISLSQILDTPLPTLAQDPHTTSQARIPLTLPALRATKAPAASSCGS